jgi:hypothetical protein
MNAHAVTYPSLQRRLITQRRTRAFFLVRTTQQVKTRKLYLIELARAAVALAAVAAWCISLLLIGS